MPLRLVESEGDSEGFVQFGQLRRGQRPQELSQVSLANTSKVVANDPTPVLQSLVDPHEHLGGQPITLGKHWGANHGRVRGIDQSLPTHDDETAVAFGISLWLMHSINVTPPHGASLSFLGTIA